MSRQAQCKTEVVVKSMEDLRDACRLTAETLGGEVVDRVRYYNGEVVGVRAGHAEIGCIVGEDGTLTFVGEDVQLRSPMGQKIQKLIKQNYSSIQVGKAITGAGFTCSSARRGTKVFLQGVKA
jgi:hypothetical protein